MTRCETEDFGGLGEDSRGDALDISGMCQSRGWSRARLIKELRSLARDQRKQLPGDESLKRMIREWEHGRRTPSDDYARLLRRAFGVAAQSAREDDDAAFISMLDRGAYAADHELVAALEGHTDSLRVLDRRLGGDRVQQQAETHFQMIEDMVRAAPFGAARANLAAAGAEAAALAGWQALDQGRAGQAWKLHDRARRMALESGDAAVIAHVTAQQAYALIDAGRPAQAVERMAHARRTAGPRVPGVLAAWLCAAEAEARAATGDVAGTSRLLEQAERELTADELPYVVLDAVHLARWRGNCLARLGDGQAVADLESALQGLAPDFNRARAGLLVDLATAYTVRGAADEAAHYAQQAAAVASQFGSQRQLARLKRLSVGAERE